MFPQDAHLESKYITRVQVTGPIILVSSGLRQKSGTKQPKSNRRSWCLPHGRLNLGIGGSWVFHNNPYGASDTQEYLGQCAGSCKLACVMYGLFAEHRVIYLQCSLRPGWKTIRFHFNDMLLLKAGWITVIIVPKRNQKKKEME